MRVTSVYTLTATVSSPNLGLDTLRDFLVERGTLITGSFYTGDLITLRFRIPTSDSDATALATTLVDLLPDVTHAELHTGAGVNRRLVAQQ